MLFKSPIFAQASGSIAGTVFSRNAGGMYVRARANPTNPNTDAQQAVRDAMRTLVNIWSNVLSDSERDGWNTYAFNTPTLNKLGEPTHKTGQQMFLRGNVPRIQAGLPTAAAPPTQFDLGAFGPLGEIITSEGDNNVSIEFDETDPWTGEVNSALLIYQSRPQNATRNFGKGPFQLATILEGQTVPVTGPVMFNSLFPLTQGQKVFLQLRVTYTDGRLTGKQNPTSVVGV